MPFTLVHGFIAYIASVFLTKDVRWRRLAFIAGIVPDLDGISLLWLDVNLFREWHHGWLHAPFTGVALGLLAAIVLYVYYSKKKERVNFGFVWMIFALGFILHPVTDVISSDWEINFGFPFMEWNVSNVILGIPDHHLVEHAGVVAYSRNDAILTSLTTIFLLALYFWNRKHVLELVKNEPEAVR